MISQRLVDPAPHRAVDQDGALAVQSTSARLSWMYALEVDTFRVRGMGGI